MTQFLTSISCACEGSTRTCWSTQPGSLGQKICPLASSTSSSCRFTHSTLLCFLFSSVRYARTAPAAWRRTDAQRHEECDWTLNSTRSSKTSEVSPERTPALKRVSSVCNCQQLYLRRGLCHAVDPHLGHSAEVSHFHFFNGAQNVRC